MSKKSYKKLQNRLYREIKRRMIAEQSPCVKATFVYPRIDTLRLAKLYPNDLDINMSEFVKKDMACEFGKRLMTDGYIKLFWSNNRYGPILDQVEIRGELKVVKSEDQ